MIAAAITTLVCIGGYFKDKRSHTISNILVFWGFIQWVSYGAQAVLSYFLADYKYAILPAAAFVFYILQNIGFFIYY